MSGSSEKPFDFSIYLDQLSPEQLEDYALRSGTSVGYLAVHLKHRRKIPRKDLLVALALESNGAFSFQDLLLWFYDLQKA